MDKVDMIQGIIQSEFRMFNEVQNIGGRASCQDDYSTFFGIRFSQLISWDSHTIESYSNDVQNAIKNGDNLLERKYAYMMQFTEPEYYANQLAPYLPVISDEKKKIVNEISGIYQSWYGVLKENYPLFVSRGRPESDKKNGMTSFITYLKGELFTYSKETLKHFLSMVNNAVKNKDNLLAITYNATARFYGYNDLDDAERELRNNRA